MKTIKYIYLKTNMEKMPNNCLECQIKNCTLPIKKNKFEPEIKKILF